MGATTTALDFRNAEVSLWRSMPDLRPESAGQDETGPWIKVASLQIKAEG